ncbi:MAG: hypothetical protein ACLRWP_16760 [Bilophila wadsworthia]
MRVGLYPKFFTWAMLNLLLGVITAVYRRGAAVQQQSVLAHAVQQQYRLHVHMTPWSCNTNPKANGLVHEECGRECGPFRHLIPRDMDLRCCGRPASRVVEAARTIPRPPYSCAPN